MQTKIPIWQFATWFLIHGTGLAIATYAMFFALKRGCYGSDTRQATPVRFWGYTILLTIAGVIFLLLFLVGVAALRQTLTEP